jgi:hypothetical protein
MTTTEVQGADPVAKSARHVQQAKEVLARLKPSLQLQGKELCVADPEAPQGQDDSGAQQIDGARQHRASCGLAMHACLSDVAADSVRQQYDIYV